VLNVGQRNAGARRVYEQLGFRFHCDFFEGEAEIGRLLEVDELRLT